MSKTQTLVEAQMLMMAFLERGGKITVGRTKRPLNSRSWSFMNMRSSVHNRGRKATQLRAAGFAKAH